MTHTDKDKKKQTIIAAVICVVILLVVIFNKQIMAAMSPAKPAEPVVIPEAPIAGEHLSNNEMELGEALGYNEEAEPWSEVYKLTELDPSTFANHYEFVKDVRRFSSGANFTSVTDDNTNAAFTNFVGLRRPSHVPIGSTARQQPDIDQSVLMRNPEFSWSSSGYKS